MPVESGVDKGSFRTGIALICYILFFIIFIIACSFLEQAGNHTYPELAYEDYFYGYILLSLSIILTIILTSILFVRWFFRTEEIVVNLNAFNQYLRDIRILLTSIDKVNLDNIKQDEPVVSDSKKK